MEAIHAPDKHASVPLQGHRVLFTPAGISSLLLCSSIGAAELNVRWHPLNEPGNLGRVEAVAISPHDSKRLLAGGDIFGVGLSTNGGVTWEQALGITACSEINDITFHPSESNVVWVGSLSGPYQSLDGGQNWALKRNGMPPMSPSTLTAPIQKVLFDPNHFETLLALAGNHRHMGYGSIGTTCWGGVWKSTDEGEHWTKLTTIDDAAVGGADDGTGVLINDAGFAAGSSSIVYACSDQGGVYKSTDAGTNFFKVNAGLPNTQAWALALHPADPGILWVSLAGGAGVWKSENGGRTWFASNRGMDDLRPTTECRTVTVARSDPNCLYCACWNRPASVYRSRDAGATWTRIISNASKSALVGGTGNPSGLVFQWLSVDPQNPAHLLGAGEGNVVQSFDAGATWKDITCVAVGPNWRGTGYSGLCCTAIGWNAYHPGQIFTLGMDAGKLLRTDDYFWSWRLADPGLIGPFNAANSATFASDGTIYVGSGQFGNQSGAYRNEPILKSTNWGATWAYVSRPESAKGDNKAVYVAPADSQQLWAIMGDQLYKSDTGGSSWRVLTLNDAGTIWDLAADPSRPGTLYVGARNGIYKSNDGTNFSVMPGSPRSSQFEYVTVDPVSPGILYAVSFNSGSLGGLYRFDGHWTRVFKKPQARAVAVDPGNPSRIAVITKWWPARDVSRADGVWISVDGGENWTQFNTGLRMLSGTTIAFNPDKSGQLILGTDGAGFYVADLGTSTPFGPAPATLPGTIQFEDFDRGGEGVAFHADATDAQGVSNYRSDSVVVRQFGHGHVIALASRGEWFKYKVNATAAGTYDLKICASSGPGARIHFEADGVNVTGPIILPPTGTTKRSVDIIVHHVRLDAGPQYLKLFVEAPGAALDYFRVEKDTARGSPNPNDGAP